jgi:hypothetical protein
LTIGISVFDCPVSVVSLATPRGLISRYTKGRFPRRLWVIELPSRSWKSIDSSGRGERRSWWSDRLLRGEVAVKWYQSEERKVLFVQVAEI